MNIVLLVGNLARDPEIRYTPGGKAVTEFTVAVNEGSGERKTVTFIRCETWEKVAEAVAERGRKGSKVAVEGRIAISKYEDRTGQKRESVKVVARSVSVLGSTTPSGEARPARQAPAPQEEEEQEDLELRDLPW